MEVVNHRWKCTAEVSQCGCVIQVLFVLIQIPNFAVHAACISLSSHHRLQMSGRSREPLQCAQSQIVETTVKATPHVCKMSEQIIDMFSSLFACKKSEIKHEYRYITGPFGALHVLSCKNLESQSRRDIFRRHQKKINPGR